MRLKYMTFAVIGVLFGVVVFLGMGELILRFLPVADGMRAQQVDAEQPVFRFEPNRDANYAKGALFQITNRVHVNNAGFVSNQDYTADDPRPLLALIGDSYVEALMVPYAQTIQGRLAADLGQRGRAYAFAASGAGLAQYLSWTRFARDTYHPQAVSIVIIPNDFSEALYERERGPGFNAFRRLPDGSAEMVLTEYRPSRLRTLMRSSALMRYLGLQVKVQTLFDTGNLSLGRHDTRYVGNIEAQAPEEYMAQSRWATDRFLDLLPEMSGLPPKRIQLVVESIRPNLYDPATMAEGEASFWGRMRAYMIEQARARGFEVIDLNPIFMERFKRTGLHFEFTTDGHWNGEGHAAAAEAIMASRVYRQVFDSGK